MEATGPARGRPEPATPRQLRLTGLLTAAVTLAALFALASFASPIAWPPAALTELVIRSVPGDVATLSIELLQHWAIRLLTAGVLTACLLAGGEALVSTARAGVPRPYLAGGALAVLAGLLTLAGPTGGVNVPAYVAALFGGALIYGAVGSGLSRLVLASGEEADAGRRRALRLGIGGAAALTVAGGAVGWAARRLAGPNTDVALGEPVARARVPQRGAWPSIDGVAPEVTSVRDHYVVDIDLVQPSVEAGGWSLGVGGLVAHPLRLGFDELQKRFELVEEYAVLTCISNKVGGDLIGHSLWGGVRLADVLEAAGIRGDPTDVKLAAADGYTESIPLAVATDPAVLLAVAQNRRPLTQAHGFPCRLRVPPIYGMKNVKWIESIELVALDYKGYWQRRGWSDVATVRTQSRIDVAGDDRRAHVGSPTWIAGVAWAGDRGISKVEVSTDEGETWTEARLRDPIGRLSWRQWALRWAPRRAGTAIVQVRATDGTGEVQTKETAAPHPSGATGYPALAVDVV
jgi:DMSO/TMAO reductase YedYZ molybdopterin-dependent catalytic subunit